MNTGTVKFYNEDKGFGFIVEDETQNEIFVHMSGLEDDIEKNDKVSYETTEGKKGLNAVSVRRV
jgi:CspA family cold shock protein